MNLVIVESPTKARTIGKFLGKDYEIKASMGHIMDLPKSTLAVDVEHDFAPLYELVLDKKDTIGELKKAAKKADNIVLATDPDREGEAIASHVKDVLGSNGKFSRVVFHEITKEAIEEAFKNPRSIDTNLVNAQTARRVLDRLVGYKLSPILWQKVRRGLSAGRVQSVTLRLIVEREREIDRFTSEKYWTITVLLAQNSAISSGSPHSFNDSSTQNKINLSSLYDNSSKNSKSVAQFKSSFREGARPSGATPNATEFELIEINDKGIELKQTFSLYDGEYRIAKTTIASLENAKKIMEDLKTKAFEISDVLQKETKRSPQPPFTTSTLQQEASRRLGFSGKRTMSLAQKLYEEGLITYHRTDSLNVSASAVSSMRNFIKKEYGDKYLPQSPRFYKTKQKLAQEAHEAIRPTKAHETPQNLSAQLGRDYFRLYDLIWRRALACQMSDAIIESTTVVVDSRGPVAPSSHSMSSVASSLRALNGTPSGRATPREQLMSPADYRLKTTGSVLVFDGFLKINPQALSDRKLPNFVTGEKLNLVDALEVAHETPPPPRYNEASLIATLEEKGIGRPSTYATIVSTIEGRQYVEKVEGRFQPTLVGIAVNDFLVKNFSTIDDIPFTAMMEDSLDEIAKGEKQWEPMIKDFYGPFSKKLEEVKNAERVKIEVEKTSEKCPLCGAPLVIRIGRFGRFLSCSTFPTCKFTKAFVEQTGLTCPKCRGKIVIKKTKRGRKFYGCSNYPKCDFAAWKIEDIKKTLPKPPAEQEQKSEE